MNCFATSQSKTEHVKWEKPMRMVGMVLVEGTSADLSQK